MQRVGPFTLRERLSAGAMGEVWLGTGGSHRVAVKVLTAAMARRTERREAFLREAEAVARTDHPAVIRVFDVGVREDGAPWMAMELASGGDLASHPPGSWPALHRVLDVLLSGLAHVHARDLLHRDLKPANVLWCTEGDARPGPKLADFGVSRLLDGEARGGTPRYMAPEQFAAQARLEGPWTDLYALGCLAFELASGQPPFRGTGRDLAQAHMQLAPPRLSPRFALPDAVEAWLARLLAKDPVERFRCAAEARAVLPTAEGRGAVSSSALELDPTLTVADAVGLSELNWTRTTSNAVPPAPRVTAPLPPAPRPSGLRRMLRGSGAGLVHRREVPLVGREAALGEVWAELLEVEARRVRRVVHLRGPVGVGTTRLASEVLSLAREAGVAGLFVDPRQHAPLRDALVDALFARGLRGPELADHLTARIGGDGLAAVLDAEVALGPAGIAGGLRSFAEGGLLVLVLDDVHEQPDSLRVVRTLRDAAVLVVMTGPLDVDVEFEVDRELVLPPLAEAHRGGLVEAALGVSMASAGRLAELGGGLPGWTLQLLDSALSQGAVEMRAEGLMVGDFDLPEPARLWSERVAATYASHPDLVEAMECAAALGQRVPRRRWHALVGDHAGSAERILVRAGLAFSAPASLVWAHVAAVDAVQERAGGRWLQHHERCLEHAQTPDERAWHLLGAGRRTEALEPLLAAAHHAHLRAEFTRAQHLYARWRALMAEAGAGPDDPRWAPGWTREAITWRFVGDYARAETLGRQVAELGERLGDDDMSADGWATVGLVASYTGRLEEGADLLHRSQARVRAPAIALRVHKIAAGVYAKMRDVDAAERALDLASRGVVPDHHAAEIERLRATVAYIRGDLAAMESALVRAIEIFGAIGDRWGLTNAHGDLGTVYYLRGQFVEAAEAYREAVEAWRVLGSDEWTTPASNLGLALVELGRFAEAREIREALARPLARIGRRDLEDVGTVMELAVSAGLDDAPAFDLAVVAARAIPVAHLEGEAPRLASMAAQAWANRGDHARADRARQLAAWLTERLG